MRLSAHLGYLFTEVPLEQRLEQAREAGFEAVEHPAPYAFGAKRLSETLSDLGLAFVQFAAPMGDTARGEKGMACLPGREAEFLNGVRMALDYAEAINCDLVHLMSGVAPEGIDRDVLMATYLRNLERAVALAEGRPVRLLIEPITAGSLPNYFMSRFDDALDVFGRVGSDRLTLLFDTYHARVNGVPIHDFIRRHHAGIAHLHLADFPGRNEPGTGELDFDDVFAALELTRYPGYLGCEYVPATRTSDGLVWVQEFARYTNLRSAGQPSRTEVRRS